MGVRVLLVDDQAVVRIGYRLILEAQPDIEVVGEADNGAVAVKMATALQPDLVVMDVRMPHMNGIEATERIVQAAPSGGPRVLIVTTFDLDEYAFEALRAGASGFILKDIEPPQLVEAVRTVHAGQALLAPRVTGALIEAFTRRPPPPSPPDPATVQRQFRLTDREMQVVRLVARGMANAEIGGVMHVGTSTVKTHVSNALTKLGLRDRVQLVVYAFEQGLAGGD